MRMFSCRTVVTVASLIATLTTGIAQAEILTGTETPMTMKTSYFRFLNDTDNNGWHYAYPQAGESLVSGQTLNLVCVDRFTKTSADFSNPEVGQEYKAVALNSPAMQFFSQTQKDALNSLFSHVYTTVVDSQDQWITDHNGLRALAFQLTVWEIMHETSGGWDVTAGVFGINAAATYNADHTVATMDSLFFAETKALAQTWFSAIIGAASWENLGYSYSNIPLTVYVAPGSTDISQTLLSTKAPSKVEGTPTVPEPASLALLGLSGAALLIRRR